MNYSRDKLVYMLIVDEGIKLEVYKDSLNIDTIGIGRNIEERGLTDAELQHLGYTTLQEVYCIGITENGAKHLLGNDIDIVERELSSVHPCIKDLNEARQIVCLNMAFNLGVPRLCKFKKMWAAIHSEDFSSAAKEMLHSRWAKQVKDRAIRLSKIMRKGKLNG